KTRTAAVHIHPADSSSALRAGMFAQLNIVTAQKQNALLVPTAAIVGADKVVAIDDNNTARLQPVTIGLKNDSVAEIVGGLNSDELVATSGAASLHEGDLVAVQQQPTVLAFAGTH